MKKIVLLVLIAQQSLLIGQTICEGTADGFPCDGYNLMDRVPLSEMDAGFGNDSWGWTDPDTGKEYALMGLDNGTAIIDVSNPTEVVYVGKIPTHTSASVWRDIKTYQNYAFIVSEANSHGMQVFDLTRLRDIDPADTPITFTEDAHYAGFGSAHNIVINTESGFAYGVGTTTFNGGPHFVNIQDPLNPIAAGGYATNNYSHDAQVVTYTGPDSDYTGREILIGSNEDLVAIVDITDKDNPVEISTVTYPTIGYTHQGWFTEDQRYFLLGDEIDEISFGFNTRTIIFDFADLDNPMLHYEYEGTSEATDHNGYVVGDKFYLASYRAGMRVLDISDIANSNVSEIGFFDTVPSSNNVGTSGLWNVYPFFASGNIVLSGAAGMTLVRDATLGIPEVPKYNTLNVYPNPVANQLHLNIADGSLGAISLYNVLGQKIMEQNIAQNEAVINVSQLKNGVYILKSKYGVQRILKKS